MRLGTPNRKGTPVHGDCCRAPFGYLSETGRLILYGKHERELHILPLTPADLRKLALLIEATCGKITASDGTL